MVLACVRHREQFGELATEAGDQPILVVVNLALDRVFLNKVGDDFNDQVLGQRIEVQLNRVRDADAAPVVIQIDLTDSYFCST